ncbi:MAG: cytochrome C oxidase subunit IV family protein [Opitutales bacterium]
MHRVSRTTYYAVFATLLVLLAITVGAAYIDLGRFGLIFAMGIAAAKALLILLFFMHLRYSSQLTVIVASAGIIWWAILVVLAMSDYLSRGWVTSG